MRLVFIFGILISGMLVESCDAGYRPVMITTPPASENTKKNPWQHHSEKIGSEIRDVENYKIH